jgi:hypothetical protein
MGDREEGWWQEVVQRGHYKALRNLLLLLSGGILVYLADRDHRVYATVAYVGLYLLADYVDGFVEP